MLCATLPYVNFVRVNQPLVYHMSEFENENVIWHIPHERQHEMAKKSEVVSFTCTWRMHIHVHVYYYRFPLV